jgi:murein peptide amidase A
VDHRAVGATRVRHAAPAQRSGKRRSARLDRALTLILLAVVVAPAAQAQTTLLGHSTQGRPIPLIEAGDAGGTPVLVVGCIHGNEPAGIRVAQLLARQAPAGVHLWIVPVLNPDGRTRNTRGNARGVDLNRNFPYRWRPLDGAYESGSRPLSEVEARLAYRLIVRIRPAVTIWFHQHLNLVWASGGDLRVSRTFARVAKLPHRRLPTLPGSAIDWQNHALSGTTAFAAELPSGAPSRFATARYARAVVAAARASRKTPSPQQTSPPAPSSVLPSRL